MDMQLPFPVTEGTSMEMKSREDLAVLSWRPLGYPDEQTGSVWAFFGGTATVTVLEPMRMLLTLTNAERYEVPALEPVEGFDIRSSLGANCSVLDEVEINFQVQDLEGKHGVDWVQGFSTWGQCSWSDPGMFTDIDGNRLCGDAFDLGDCPD